MGRGDRAKRMSSPGLHVSASLVPSGQHRNSVPTGNAEGNARSTECSPGHTCTLPPNRWRATTARVLQVPVTVQGSASCDVARRAAVCAGPIPPPSAARGAATQRGRERPPSKMRQVTCRLAPEGRSRPRSTRVDVRVMRRVMPSAQRPVMTAPICCQSARHMPGSPTAQTPPCHLRSHRRSRDGTLCSFDADSCFPTRLHRPSHNER